MLRKILFSVGGLALALGYLACQSDVTEPNVTELSGLDEERPPGIYG